MTGPEVSEDRLLDAMVAHPLLVNRSIVSTPRGVRLGRPSEAVLDRLPPGPMAKEGGTPLIDPEGRRVGRARSVTEVSRCSHSVVTRSA